MGKQSRAFSRMRNTWACDKHHVPTPSTRNIQFTYLDFKCVHEVLILYISFTHVHKE